MTWTLAVAVRVFVIVWLLGLFVWLGIRAQRAVERFEGWDAAMWRQGSVR